MYPAMLSSQVGYHSTSSTASVRRFRGNYDQICNPDKGTQATAPECCCYMTNLASDNPCLKGSEWKHWLDKSCSGSDNASELCALMVILRFLISLKIERFREVA